jgi:hypothetical protein
MNLDEAQKQHVAGWIREGLKLSDIQKRLESELGVKLTYMEVRFLVDDLKLVPKDIEPAKPLEVKGAPSNATSPSPGQAAKSPLAPGEPAPAKGGVSLKVDHLARPGAIVSGNVTFSDGKSAEWYLDQMGRLGLVPKETGYKPSPADLQSFQMTLESELSRMGF